MRLVSLPVKFRNQVIKAFPDYQHQGSHFHINVSEVLDMVIAKMHFVKRAEMLKYFNPKIQTQFIKNIKQLDMLLEIEINQLSLNTKQRLLNILIPVNS